jgi:hypothetical protein
VTAGACVHRQSAIEAASNALVLAGEINSISDASTKRLMKYSLGSIAHSRIGEKQMPFAESSVPKSALGQRSTDLHSSTGCTKPIRQSAIRSQGGLTRAKIGELLGRRGCFLIVSSTAGGCR